MASVARGLARGRRACCRSRASCSPRAMTTRLSSREALREAALPRGRLRAALGQAQLRTTSTSTASRRGRTCSAPLGEAIAAAVAEHEPEAVRIAAPELGAVALAAAASLARRPAVRDRARRGEGARHRATGSRASSRTASASASSRTSSPPAARRSRRSRPARAGCGSPTPFAWSTARRAAPTRSPARPSASGRSSAASELGRSRPPRRMVERYPTPLLGSGQGPSQHPRQEETRALTKQEFIQKVARKSGLSAAMRARPSTRSWSR